MNELGMLKNTLLHINRSTRQKYSQMHAIEAPPVKLCFFLICWYESMNFVAQL